MQEKKNKIAATTAFNGTTFKFRRFKIKQVVLAAALISVIKPVFSANVTWVGPNNSFWDLAANWNPVLPGASDDVQLGAFNTTFRSGSVDVSSLTGSGQLSLTGGILQTSGASSVSSFNQSSGSFGGTGTLTIAGPSSFTFGDHRGTGTTILQGASNISSSGFRLDGGRVLRNENTLTWNGGQLLFNNNLNGTSIAGSGTINNVATGTFIASGDSTLGMSASNFGGADTGADAVFNNAGTFRKSGSAATNTTTMGVAFNNTGTVDVQTGILNLTNGGTHTGAFTGTGTMGFGGGTQTLNAGANVTTQNVNFSGSGTTNVNSTYNVAGTTTMSGGVANINGTLASLGSELNITNGVLNLNSANASVGSLTQSGGSLSGSGTATITGPANITFGDHSGTGTTILQGASNISSSGFRLDGGRVLRNENTLTWNGGQLLLNNNLNGTSIAGSGTINNTATGTFIASGNNTSSIFASNFGGADTGADAVFNNAGTFRKSGSTATNTTTVGVAFNNTGTVDVQTGILNLTNGGTHTGAFTGTGTMGFGGGTQTLNAGANVTTQNVNFSGSGTTNVNSTYNVAGTTTMSGGVANINGTLASLGSVLNITNGLLNLNSANASVGSLTQSSGSLAGSGTTTITGPVNITFGDHSGTGTTILQGASSISSSGFRLDGGRVLRNENTLTWNGGQLLFNNNVNGDSIAGSGTINNTATGTLIASGNNTSSIFASNFGGADTGADAVFNNAGTFRKSGSIATNTTTVGVAFNNTGTVDMQTGILNLTNGGTHAGNFDVAAGAVLGFGGGTHNLNGGAIKSPGTVRVNGTTNVNVNTAYGIAGTTDIQSGFFNVLGGNASTGTLKQSSGSVTGTNNFTVTGSADFTFGDHRGTGTTILQGASSISSSGFQLDGGRVLRNENTLTWSGGQLLLNNNVNGISIAGSGTINNTATGTLIASGNNANGISASNFGGADTGADSVFNNAGTFRKSGSTATNTTTVGVAFNNSGAVDVQTGKLVLSSPFTNQGSIKVDAGATVQVQNAAFNNQGTLQGNGSYQTLNSSTALVNAGTLAPGVGDIGALAISGDYTQLASGFLDIELGSLTNFDKLNVLGDMNLSGTLRIASLDGYNPNQGGSFTIATFDDGVADVTDLTGIFSNIEWSGFNSGVSFTASYFDHSIVLNATAAPVPVPAAIWLFGSGMVGIAAGFRRKHIKA